MIVESFIVYYYFVNRTWPKAANATRNPPQARPRAEQRRCRGDKPLCGAPLLIFRRAGVAEGRSPASYCHAALFQTPPLRTLHPSFPETKLSSWLDVWTIVAARPPVEILFSVKQWHFDSPKPPAISTHQPVPLRPVNGVTVALDGRDPIDYYWDSVTI